MLFSLNYITDFSTRVLYKLTPQGEDLKEIMSDIHKWSDKWYSVEDCANS